MTTRNSRWRQVMWVGLSGFVLLSALGDCGGKTVVDEVGSTTTGTTTGTTTTGSPTGTTTGTTPTGSPTGTTPTGTTSSGTTTTTTTPITECEQACFSLFDCTQQDDLCPGMSAGDEPWFVPQCVEMCDQMPAMIALINPQDCAVTVQTLAAVSADFASSCYGMDSGQ